MTTATPPATHSHSARQLVWSTAMTSESPDAATLTHWLACLGLAPAIGGGSIPRTNACSEISCELS